MSPEPRLHGADCAPLSAFRQVPKTGVIYVMAEAARHGYRPEDPDWANLGQGQPETGSLPGAPPRISSVLIDVDDNEYAPVAGLPELREAVAALYNRLYRKGMASLYTGANVAICGGGRLGLTRAVASLGEINLGHFLPDYTAYEELLDVFRSFTPIPLPLAPDRHYAFDEHDLRNEILGRGLGAVLLSNPGNPTGRLLQGEALRGWVDVARDLDCALLFDEFYSNYVWVDEHGYPQPDLTASVSAARYVEDVERDPIVIFNGLTKNFRYPGWRISWVVGPSSVIEAVSSAGSFLDGGGSRPLQRAALPLLEPDAVRAETRAIRRAFAPKRERMLEGLQALGVRFDLVPEGAFYLWGDVSRLPAPFHDSHGFFQGALEHQVICVPGEFFDVNPGKRRSDRRTRYRQYVRFSFGPSADNLERGLASLARMLKR